MSTVAYVGNFGPPHSTENHYAASFDALGWDVIAIQEDELIHSGQDQEHLQSLVRTRAIDLLLHTRTWGLPEPWATNLWRAAEANGTPTAAVHLDVWHGLAREGEVGQDSMFRMGTVFTADGDHEDEFEAAGINHEWLRAGVYHAECYDGTPDPEWEGRWDVAFVGSAPTTRGGNYHDEWSHRRELVARLEDWYGDRFVHVGNGGHLANNTDRPNLRGDDLNRFYASVPVTVGDSCNVTPHGRYWSDRVYEAPGRGGFLIHPWVEAIEDELGAYPCWPVGHWEKLHDVIEGWLHNPESREAKRRQIAERVREHCTYRERVGEMLDVLGIASREAVA
jgi:hypothetical protein